MYSIYFENLLDKDKVSLYETHSKSITQHYYNAMHVLKHITFKLFFNKICQKLAFSVQLKKNSRNPRKIQQNLMSR